MISPIVNDLRPRLDTFATNNPEWQAWLSLFAQALRASDKGVWNTIALQINHDRPAAAPLLDGATLRFDTRRTQNWLHNFIKKAAKLEGSEIAALTSVSASNLDSFALLQAAIAQDQQRISDLAHPLHVVPQALSVVAQLAVMPLLQACRQLLTAQLQPTWTEGYCPVCGAWPTLVEIRGLERTRQCRCGRCGGEWQSQWLRCVYCGETDHQQLGFLVPEANVETHKLETCHTCLGYVKTMTTLQARPPYAAMLDDLETVALDLIALARGYARPERPGYAVQIECVASPSRLSTLLGRSR